MLPPSRTNRTSCIAEPDERNEWQGRFPWDLEVDIANKEVFQNEAFREN